MIKKVRGIIHSRRKEGIVYFDVVAKKRGRNQGAYIAEVVNAEGKRVWCLAAYCPERDIYYAADTRPLSDEESLQDYRWI